LRAITVSDYQLMLFMGYGQVLGSNADIFTLIFSVQGLATPQQRITTQGYYDTHGLRPMKKA